MKPNYFINPLFLLSLTILLVNDFFLKQLYHNWITGKLSDLFGLIVFVMFLTSFASQYKKLISIGVAVLFSFWKTPLSQFAIDFWNTLQVIQFERTVDYTDIFCVAILIPLFFYRPSIHYVYSKTKLFKTIKYSISIITLFAIMSTSQMRYAVPPSTKIDKYITVKTPKDSFFRQLDIDKINYRKDSTMVVKKHILDKYILQDMILDQDTIYRITIGVKGLKYRTKIYIDSLIFKQKTDAVSSYYITTEKKWLKRYKVDIIDFLKNNNQ
ncbi:hypothetical protein ACWGOQ_0017700 [Aquimarina sp. M1]